MNRLRYMQTGPSILIAIAGFAGTSVSAQVAADASVAKLSTKEMRTVAFAAQRPVKIALWTMTQDFTGSFETMAKQWDEFNKEFETQKLSSQFKTKPTSVIVLYEDPTGKREFRFALGLETSKQLEVKSPLKLAQIEKSEAVRYTHVGSYQKLKAVHDAIEVGLKKPAYARTNAAAARERNAEWPVVLRLLNDPRKIQPAQLKTEIIVPAS